MKMGSSGKALSTGMKFGITAAVVIGVVALGYWMQKKQQAKTAAASPDSKAPINPSTAPFDFSRFGYQGEFARNPDGSYDYTTYANGQKVMLG